MGTDNHNPGDKRSQSEKQNPSNQNEQRHTAGSSQNPQRPADMGKDMGKDAGKKSVEQSRSGQQGNPSKR